MPNDKGMQVIFSLRDGDVWISLKGNPAPIRIGRQDEVTAAMRDFIAQGEVANRLLSNANR